MNRTQIANFCTVRDELQTMIENAASFGSPGIRYSPFSDNVYSYRGTDRRPEADGISTLVSRRGVRTQRHSEQEQEYGLYRVAS
jgi:hypothetical protein